MGKFLIVLCCVGASPAVVQAQAPARSVVVYGNESDCEPYRVLLRHDSHWSVRCDSENLSSEAVLMERAHTMRSAAAPGFEPLLLAQMGDHWLVYDVARDGALDLPADLDAQREVLLRLAPTPGSTATPVVATPSAEAPPSANELEQFWPYVVAGVLLVGGVVAVVVLAGSRSEPSPTLHVETVPLLRF